MSPVASALSRRATGTFYDPQDPDWGVISALSRVEGKAEIIRGQIVLLPMSGIVPAYAAAEIFVSLRAYVRRAGFGFASSDGLDYIVRLPDRRSFRPDASYFRRPVYGMREVDGPPDFAVEVRSKNDYGPAAERDMLQKRADYFAAGTLVVWDVDAPDLEANPHPDPLAAVVRVYRGGDPEHPAATYRHGDLAAAEPAVPGWTFPVDDLIYSPAPPPADR